MADEVIQLPSFPRQDTCSPGVKPLADDLPPIERETNTMSQGKLDRLRELFSFPSNIQIKHPKADETITFTRPRRGGLSQGGLHFFLHPSIRKILYFYNICPVQLVPNAWRSLVCAIMVW